MCVIVFVVGAVIVIASALVIARVRASVLVRMRAVVFSDVFVCCVVAVCNCAASRCVLARRDAIWCDVL